MEYRQINDNYAVTGQIEPDDVTAIKAAGFRSIVCNRPDNEQPGQTSHSAIEQAAKEAGLGFRYVPVVSGGITPGDVDQMADALEELEGPVFAYCRSGARSANIYAMAQDKG